MGIMVDIPFRKIRGTPEWEAEQKKLREAWEVIEGKLEELGIKTAVLEGSGDRRDLVIGSSHKERRGTQAISLVRALREMALEQRLEKVEQVNRLMCMGRRADGGPCRYPAREDDELCQAHAEWEKNPLGFLPFPDDALGLQRVLAMLLGRVLYEKLDPARARAAAEVCRMMQKNLERMRREAEEAGEELFL